MVPINADAALVGRLRLLIWRLRVVAPLPQEHDVAAHTAKRQNEAAGRCFHVQPGANANVVGDMTHHRFAMAIVTAFAAQPKAAINRHTAWRTHVYSQRRQSSWPCVAGDLHASAAEAHILATFWPWRKPVATEKLDDDERSALALQRPRQS